MSIGPVPEHPESQGDPQRPHAGDPAQQEELVWPAGPQTGQRPPPWQVAEPAADTWSAQYDQPTVAQPAIPAHLLPPQPVSPPPTSMPPVIMPPVSMPSVPPPAAVSPPPTAPQQAWSGQHGSQPPAQYGPVSGPPQQAWSAPHGTATPAPTQYGPVSGPPQHTGGQYGQVSGPPQQYGAQYSPVPSPPQQTGGQYGQVSGPPQQYATQYGQVSGPPQQYGQVSGPPQQYATQYGQVSGPPQQQWTPAATPPSLPVAGVDDGSPRRGRTALWLLVGLLVGALAAGPIGYFVSDASGGAEPNATGSPSPGPGASLSAYETVRKDLNKQKLSGDLAALGDPWLPYLGGCTSNTDPNGPALNQGEKLHVACMYGGIAAHFAIYETSATRDDARDYHEKLNTEAANLAPGLAAPEKKNGAQTKAPGQYIEYAYRLSTGITICGVWWDRDDNSSALTLEAICDRELGGKWEPLRELWQRYS